MDQSSVVGQIGLNSTEWPFIQTFDFTQGEFDIILEQAGANEVVTLDYDSDDLDDYAGIELDRNQATQGSEVFLFITDNQLNIDPTNEDIVIFNVTSGSEAVIFTNGTTPNTAASDVATHRASYDNYFSDNGKLIINYDVTSVGVDVFTDGKTIDDDTADKFLVFYEDADNTGTFSNIDDDDNANLDVNTLAKRGTTATIDYNDSAQSFIVANDFGSIDMDETSIGEEWNSGEVLAVTLYDQDLNKNTGSDEDLKVSGLSNQTTAELFSGLSVATLVPSLQIGSPVTVAVNATLQATDAGASGAESVTSFSKIATLRGDIQSGTGVTTVALGYTYADIDAIDSTYTFCNLDFTSFGTVTDIDIMSDNTELLCTISTAKGLTALTMNAAATSTDVINAVVTTTTAALTQDPTFVADVFSFGDRTNNAIYRLELEESGDNTGEFVGDVEFIMLNQINIDSASTFSGIETISDTIEIIVHEDLTDEDAPRINFLDLGADGVSTQVADQVAAPSHSGVVTFDSENYKIADTVVITLDDQDMNTDSELIDVYIADSDDKVGNAGTDHLMDVTFNDQLWQAAAAGKTDGSPDDGLEASGFTIVETGVDSGIFVGSFQVPSTYYDAGSLTTVTTTGTDIEVNYNDHRDASGETIEVGAGASINANTGSIALDRTVYPVPWGNHTADTRFALHSAAANLDGGTTENALAQGDVVVHLRITDADYDVSAFGEDKISDTTVTIKLTRGSNSTTLATVGNAANPITEVSPTSGVFEYDQTVSFIDGVENDCPTAFADGKGFAKSGCVLQGDIITVTYSDLNDASGQPQTVTDSATFDLRNGVLQSDKSVYLIGSDMILTLIDPDLDLDNDGAESYTLDLIEWDSDAATTSMGLKGLNGGATNTSAENAAFDPEPSAFRETGDSTGIFQVVIEIPETLDSEGLDRGEMIELEYTDWGPAGADYVGQEDEDIGLTVYTSNFGATIELDQKVYTWTDKVYITIVAPDHNMDSGLVDEIGNTSTDPIKVSTRGNELSQYKLVESGADTGIFIGEVTLAGFKHDADGDGTNDITATAATLTTGSGPTEGALATTDNDGLTVSFEFSEDETVVGSALIRWNIGEVQWLEASYPASGTGVVRVIDADMNLDPEAIDNFAVDAWSDSDAGGIDLTVTETNEATGIFEGTVFFTVSNDSSGHRLRVAEGDTVTAEYEDNTLPDPYTTADELDITATTLIGTVVPPLERAPAANLRTVDAFGNSLNSVSVDQQVQISADLANGQDREQSFAYLVQIQDGDGVTVSLAWITGSLSSGQSFSPALSWIPTESGSYTATAFVWESVDNPTALSPPVSTTISVQ